MKKGDLVYDNKREVFATVKRVHKPKKGSALENEPILIDVKYDDGSAINMPVGDRFVLADQLSKGTKVELEHKDTIKEIASGNLTTEEAAQKIAEDHIEEDKNYYDKLEEMEGIIDGEPEKETINKIGEQFKVSRSWVDENGSYTNDPSKRAKVLIRVSHKAEVMVLTYPSVLYPNKVTNSEAVDVMIKDKNITEAMIYNPSTIEQLKQAISMAKERGMVAGVIYDIQKNYFSNVVAEDPSKLSDFLLEINNLGKKERFNFQTEISERYGNSTHIERFIESIEKGGYNLYELLPESFKKEVKVKSIDFTPSPDSDGLAKITDIFTTFDDLRPSLMGTYFDKENNLIACTNAHILLLISAMPDVDHSSICLMGKKLDYYNKERDKTIKEREKLESQGKKIVNEAPEQLQKNEDGCWELTSQKYPAYLNVISREYPNVMDVDVEKISTYLKASGENLASAVTQQVFIGYTENDGDKLLMGVNAFFMLDCLKGMQMLGHKRLDFCHGGGASKGFTIVPSGNSRKIARNSITTDLALCMPLMVREQNDYETIYDLTDNTIKTVAQFYGRETKAEVILEPIIEPTPIEVVDPIEPVEEVAILEPIVEPIMKKSNEDQEIKDTIDGLEILKDLATSKKEKKEIQDTIDGLKILLEMPETFGLGGDVNGSKMLNGYSVRIYSDGTVSANNIVSTKEGRIILVTDGSSGDSSAVLSDEPHLKLNTRNIQGKKILSAEPVNFGSELKHKMFGGTFVWSSDSRFRQDVSEQPIQLHDRVEYADGGVIEDNWETSGLGAKYISYKRGTIYKNVDGYGAKVGYGTNQYLFDTLDKAKEWVDYRTAELDMYQMGEQLDDETDPKEKEKLRLAIKEAEDIVNKYENKKKYKSGGVMDSEMMFIDGNTTYKIEKIPNENRYGIYVTSDEFMDSFGGSTALVNVHSKSVEEAQEKIKKMIENKMYALGGVLDKNEIISQLPE